MTSDRTPQAATLRCMNVKYSPNLGDGLLSECLESALIRAGASTDTSSIDLAARTDYGLSAAGRGTLLAILDSLPAALRHHAVRLPLALAARRKWGPHYARGLNRADAVVIGGGNLLSDHDLNFPTKLALALDSAAALRLPVAIYACGMSASWTEEGERRLRRALRAGAPRVVLLRDTQSCDRWNARFSADSGCTAQVVRDPGLLAVDTWGSVPRPRPDAPPNIGLGIMSHVALRYHCDASLGEAALGRWYVDVAKALKARGAEVTGFTNGAPEDRDAAQTLAPELRSIGIAIQHPGTPAELSAITGGFSAIVAYRMHAVIAAYSHAVPALALQWDDKLDAFMASVDRVDWLADPARLTPDEAADRLLTAARNGIDPVRHGSVMTEARDGVRRLLRAVA